MEKVVTKLIEPDSSYMIIFEIINAGWLEYSGAKNRPLPLNVFLELFPLIPSPVKEVEMLVHLFYVHRDNQLRGEDATRPQLRTALRQQKHHVFVGYDLHRAGLVLPFGFFAPLDFGMI